jgi:arylsulfatase A-like enzyme
MPEKVLVRILVVVIIISAVLGFSFYYYPKISMIIGHSVKDLDQGGSSLGDSGVPKNVILITLDTIRADHVHFLGYERETTPFLDRFAKDAVVFEQAHCTLPLTTPSHTSMLTGLYPIEHKVRKNVMKTDAELLSQLLSRNGYNTSAFVSSKIVNPLNKGFDVFNFKAENGYEDNEGEFTLDQARVNRRGGENTLSEFKQWINEANASQPMFIWVHFYDAHSPYISEYKDHFGANMSYDEALGIVKKNQNSLSAPNRGKAIQNNNSVQSWESAQDQILRLYDGGVYSVDKYTEEVIKELDNRGMLDNAIVIIASDHGENLGERDDYFHGKDVYDATTRVPLLINVPGIKPKKISQDVSLVSITPTILDYLGIIPEENLTGESLIPLMRGKDEETHAIIESDLVSARQNPRTARANQSNITNVDEESGLVKNVDRIVMCLKQDNRCSDPSIKGISVAVVKDHKKIIYNGGLSVEFYDLAKDPVEAHNIYGQDDSSQHELVLDNWIIEHTNVSNKNGRAIRNLQKLPRTAVQNNSQNKASNISDKDDMIDREALQALKSLGYVG